MQMLDHKVLIVGESLSYPNGMASAERALQIAHGFKANGWTPVLAPLRKASLGNCAASQIEGVDIVDMFSPAQSSGFLRPSRAGFRLLYCEVKKNDYKMVFSLTTTTVMLFKLWFVCRLLGKQLVYDIVEDPLGKFLNRPPKVYSPYYWYETILFIIDGLLCYLIGWRFPSHLAVISHELEKMVKRLRISLHPSYLPILKKISNANHAANPVSGRDICYCGSLSFAKDGIKTMLEAVSILKKNGADVRLYLYGKGRKFDLLRMKWLIKRLNIADNVVIAGFVTKEELVNRLESSFALVLPKPDNLQNRYNFATKLIDYLESRRPCILSDVGEVKYFFRDRENALLFQSQDSNQLASALKWLMKNPEKADLIGLNGYATFVAEFDAERRIAELLHAVS